MSIAGILRRWAFVNAVTGVLTLLLAPCVRRSLCRPSRANPPAGVGSRFQPEQMPPSPSPNQLVPMLSIRGASEIKTRASQTQTAIGAPAAVAGTVPVTHRRKPP